VLHVLALARELQVKKGQLAHLDRSPANDAPDNPLFLCLAHDDEYDSRTSQSKNLTEQRAPTVSQGTRGRVDAPVGSGIAGHS